MRITLIIGFLLLTACSGNNSAPGPTTPPPPTPPPLVSVVALSGGFTPVPGVGPDNDTKYYIGNTANATLTASASSTIGLTSVQLLVDNVYVDTAIDSAAISFTLVAADYSNGLHTFTVRAYDNDGVFADRSIDAVIDHTAPVGVIVSPTNGTNITGGDLIVQTNIVDANMYTVQLLVDGANYSFIQAFNVGPNGHILTGNYPPGPHAVTIICTDKARNVLSNSVNVTW